VNDLAWLAGFLEAEGCFRLGTHENRKKDGKSFDYIHLSAVSSDKDVIDRAASIMNIRASGPTARKHSLGRKPVWNLITSGNRAAPILKLILPFMGARRTARISAMLRHWSDCKNKHNSPRSQTSPDYSLSDDVDISWLSGFLEGEGSFLLRKTKRQSADDRLDVAIYAISTDEDVLRKAAGMMGSPVYSRKPRGISKKLQWETHLRGKRAAELMRKLLPYMGTRRAEKIAALLSAWTSRNVEKRREEFGLPPSCHPDRPHCANGLCRPCYEHANRGKRRLWRRDYKRRRRAAGVPAYAA